MSKTTEEKVKAELLAVLQAGRVTLAADLPDTDPKKKTVALVSYAMTNLVGQLRNTAAHPEVRNLMSLVWALLEHHVVFVTLGSSTDSLCFTIFEADDKLNAMVLVPMNWPQLILQNQHLQLGAMVMIGSQCADFYHGKFKTKKDSEAVVTRARAYEAEYLLGVSKETLPLVPYQKNLLQEFPRGLDSLPIWAGSYVPGPFVANPVSSGT
jgi:hypothetical protein